jgi:hypothetical protein
LALFSFLTLNDHLLDLRPAFFVRNNLWQPLLPLVGVGLNSFAEINELPVNFCQTTSGMPGSGAIIEREDIAF